MDVIERSQSQWRRAATVAAAAVVFYDAAIIVSTLWTSKRGKRERPETTTTNKRNKRRPHPIQDWKRTVRRKLFLLNVPWRLLEWLLGEGKGRNDRFFHDEDQSTTSSSSQEDIEPRTLVLFFPDDGLPCKAFYESRAGCPKTNCPFLHEETAYQRLIDLLRSAQVSLDVCVFCITCADLVSVLIDRQRYGNVAVRVITDSEQLRITGSQIGKLRNEGVRVRHDNSSYLMHHKFAIIDGETVLNGSFNWTRTAITGNHENLVVSKEEYLVRAFTKQFESLWDRFHPKHQKGFSEKPTRETWVTADYMR